MSYSKIWIVIVLLLSLCRVSTAQISSGTIMWDGIERDYILQIPTGYTEGEEIPLVFNFHGFGSNAIEQQFYSGMIQLANSNKFAVCYPNGVDNAWNVGWSFGSQADDVGFTVALLEKLKSEYSINERKVYSCGMSNGGFFSYVLACEIPDKIAAIASVTGGMVDSYVPDCNPDSGTPVMQIHGTEDGTVGYEGTEGVSIPIESVVSLWTEKLSCTASPDTTIIEDINTTDMSTAIRIDYTDCNDNLEVVFYKIDGGGHTWPGAPINLGVTNYDFSASEVIWEFFNRFELPLNTNTTSVALQSVDIFPNPTQDFLQVKGLDASAEFIIYDMLGSIQLRGRMDNHRIAVKNLVTGTYLLEFTNEKISKKFIKI